MEDALGPPSPPSPSPDPGAAPAGERRPLDRLFAPRRVAVIGANERPGSVGRTLLANLLATPFGGPVVPVNPMHERVLGVPAYPAIGDVPGPVELAVIATPAPTVPDVVRQCAEAGVRGAVVISAGFREVGPEGAELERQVLEHARRGRMRLIGPNCLGLMNPPLGLNATFAGAMARPGSVALLSQSGALCTAILDWSLRELVGFSAFVSTGSMVDVGWGDLIDYLADDPHTKSILIYMETVGDPEAARAFLSAAREVALSKPVIVLKAGRTEAAGKAAASHTGALVGNDDVLDAAFRRTGVLRVDTIADLFHMAEVLARQPRPKGPRLTILTNAGGPAVLATDALIGGGGELAALSPESVEALDQFLPPHWSRGNPIDLLGDAGADRYGRALPIAAADPNTDGLLVILTPQRMTDPTATAEGLKLYAAGGKPVLASWMGGSGVEAGRDALNRAAIPTFSFPDAAARAFCYMWRHTCNLRGIYETPALLEEGGASPAPSPDAGAVLAAAAASGRALLDEAESKRLLAAYGIPTVPTRVAATADEAVRAAEAIGYPVVLKLFSRTLTHKSDVGGVELDLAADPDVRAAFARVEAAVAARAGPGHFLGVTVQPMVRLPDACEVILGSSIDAQFGPVVLFGAGGRLVEVLRDRATGLPPLNATLARRMMEQTKVFRALQGVRGRGPADLAALQRLVVRFSQLVLDRPRVREIDVNPLLVSPEGIVAVDARVVLFPTDVPDAQLPRPAIRPYPAQYVAPWVTRDGTPVTIRPVRPEDEPLLRRFHGTLSDETVQLRYFHAMKLSRRVAHERLSRTCFVDYDRTMVLVAERCDAGSGAREVLAVARLGKRPGGGDAEFALLISDRWQGHGLGTELLRRLLRVARDEGIQRVTAEILPGNVTMQRVCEALGFRLRPDPAGAGGEVHAEFVVR